MNDQPRGLVHHTELRRMLVKLRVPLGIVVLLLIAKYAQRDWLLAGFLVSMLGELIQVWCFASLDKESTLAVRGPYTMVRNPMYLGRYFIVLGFIMLLGNWWVLAGYTVVYWLYMDARVQREERRLSPIFGEPYERYCATVRRFVPGLPATGEKVCYWNWTLFHQNHAATNAIATVAAWALIAVAVLWGLPFIR
jgi:protein-S-isoprenylcysteine O-methyltransferase Ste14